MEKLCLHCGDPLPEGSHPKRKLHKYCEKDRANSLLRRKYQENRDKHICRYCKKEVLPEDGGYSRKRVHKECQENYTNNYLKNYYNKNLEKNRKLRREYTREYRKKHPERRLLIGAKTRAKNKNLDFDLEEKDIVIPDLCPILQIKMELKTPYAPSIDRIVPELGYVKGNIQVISRKANTMKNDATEQELRSFAEWVKKTYPT